MPVEVEAESIITLLTYAEKNWHDLPDWVIAEYDKGNIVFRPEGMDIITEEGVMTGNPADILIQGVEGEIYPCKASIFDATYELVKE